MKYISNFKVLLVLDDIYCIASFPFAWLSYLVKTRIFAQPYFGIWMNSNPGNPLRYPFMRRAVLKCASNNVTEYNENNIFKVMEIGAYAGASTIEFASALKSQRFDNFLIFSVDPWDSYLDINLNKRIQYRLMNHNLSNGNILRLFARNIRFAGVGNFCRQFRGTSDEMLPMIKDQLFDFIYIDGDHTQKSVLADLNAAKRLLKPGGYLSGDDLELQLESLDETFLQLNADYDIALDPASGKVFHPGVTLAVHQFFSRSIACYDGFWVVRWTGKEFEDVELDAEAAR